MTTPQIEYQTQGLGDYQAIFYPMNGSLVISSIRTFSKTTAQANYSSITQGLQLQLNDLSSSAQQYTWDFGDGNTSNQALGVISHTYSNPRSYTVCLSALHSCGNVDDYCTTIGMSALTFDGNNSSAIATFTVYPNPATDYIIVNAPTAGRLNVISRKELFQPGGE